MPFAFSAEQTRPTDTVARIEGFSVRDANETSGPRLEILYSVGRVVDGVYAPRETRSVVATVAATRTAMAAAPVGASLYAALKTALYDLLAASGELPAGSVT